MLWFLGFWLGLLTVVNGWMMLDSIDKNEPISTAQLVVFGTTLFTCILALIADRLLDKAGATE